MAEEKKKAPSDGKRKTAGSEKTKKTDGKGAGKGSVKSAAKKNYEIQIEKNELANRQRRSLIMFISAILLAAIIFIPGEMVWLWLHNTVRGLCSVLALFWPVLLLFLAVVTMLEKKIPKLWKRVLFACGFILAMNAAIFIFTYSEGDTLKQVFQNGSNYKGGGALGFIFGIPFVKLCGVIPAKILIILVMVVLLMLLTNITLEMIYNFAFKALVDLIKDFFTDSIAEFKSSKQKKAKSKKLKVPLPDPYFDEEDYEDFEEDEYDEDDEEFLPQSPVLSNSRDDDGMDSIDIDIDSDDDDLNIMSEFLSAETLQSESNESDREEKQNDDDVFLNLFDDEFTDVMGADGGNEKPMASKIAEKISLSKKTPTKSDPSQKQYDPQTVPVEVTKTKPKAARERDMYAYPPVELLSEGNLTKNSNADAELRENAKKLIDTLESFSVGAKIVGYCRGPSITRYEIQPAPGVKISKITGLSDDIALNLAAEGVRIEAPIPGKPAIGIEVPNKSVTPVTIRELIDSEEFRKHKSKLACVLGRDVAGKIIITDLAKMPHLLIAGTTGSGKSVCVNAILMSLIFKSSSEEVKLILIDPKLVEFSKYKGIPHLLIPVVSDAKKAAGALNWAVSEMEKRYKEFSIYNVKDIDSYNKMVSKNLATMTDEEFEENEPGEVIDGEFIPPKAKKKMPKIVIAIDELADLMMVAPGEVEESICRLAQKARAAGMHLVIATQRPSVNVITGVIKANIPSRISLKVASYVDSKTILDAGGGEKLIGRGDMLYSPVGIAKPLRVQGCFSSDDDIESVTDFIKKHSSADYDEDVSQEIDRIAQEELAKSGKDSGGTGEELDDSDPMLEDAIKVVAEAGQASTSLLQRRLRLGYARAGRLIDTMEQMGIVGPHEGSKSRKVLLTYEQWLERRITGSAD